MIEDTDATGGRVWLIAHADSPYAVALIGHILMQEGFVVALSDQPERLQARFPAFDHALVCLGGKITDAAAVEAAVQTTLSCFGQIDVLLNTVGCGPKGAVETLSDAEARQMFEVNLFGLLNLTRNVLPHMRSRAEGHVINVAFLPEQGDWGIGRATRRAIDGLLDSLSRDLTPQGVHVTLLTAGITVGAGTDWQAVTEATCRLVEEAHPPLRLVLGRKAYESALSCLETVQAEMRNWAPVSLSADRAA